MFYRDILKILGFYLFGLAGVLLIPLGVAAYFEFFAGHPQPHSTLAFLGTILVCLTLAGAFTLVGKGTSGHLHRKEGLAAVVLMWVLTPAIGALPFYFSGTLTNYVQAYFEAASGLTTTGSTVMKAKAFNDKGQEIPIVQKFCGTHPTTYIYYGTIAPVRDSKGKIILEGVEAVSLGVVFGGVLFSG